ncbi:MAG: hypothetical protein M3083_08950 [Actinomycetota bacterium]|nr:hypothetical protein [Actinomycetota bacterium]MDQ6947122.1 hypothetical protein [Actinomycetota bacterium]
MFILSSARADTGAKTALTRQLLDLGAATGNPPCRAAGHYAAGESAFFEGQFHVAELELKRAVALCDLVPDGSLVDAFFGLDPAVLGRSLLSWTLCLMGQERPAREVSEESVRRAQVTSNPYRLGMALTLASTFGVLDEDPTYARQRSDESLAVCEKFGIPDFVLSATVLGSWARVAQGELSTAFTVLQENVATTIASGMEVMATLYLALLGDALHRAGDHDHALATVDYALARSDATGMVFYQAELYRMHSRLIASCRPALVDEAQASRRRAIEIADRQGATRLRRRAGSHLEAL